MVNMFPVKHFRKRNTISRNQVKAGLVAVRLKVRGVRRTFCPYSWLKFIVFYQIFEAISILLPYIVMEYDHEEAPDYTTVRGGFKSIIPGPLSLPEEQRPRERLIRGGPESLSDEDLLSIILVSGFQGKNVTLLARELLEKLDSEKNIPRVEELRKIPGMGVSKACTMAAMLEFGRRKWAGGQRIKHPGDIYTLIRHYADRRQERFLCLSLNGAHEVIATRIVTIGLVNRTIIHPREVFADPILDRASAIIVAHNHPSGNLQPSEEDNDITYRLNAAAHLLGINFLDHLIFSEVAYFSFRQEGLIKKNKGNEELGSRNEELGMGNGE